MIISPFSRQFLLTFFVGLFSFFAIHAQKSPNSSPTDKILNPMEGNLRSADPSPDIRPILAPPGNDNCASATTLTVGAACVNGTTDEATTQGGEYLCINPGGGITPETVWYRFTATNDSMVLGFVQTNNTNCATVLALYGPFSAGGGCLPGAGSQLLCQNMGLIDPGFHPLLTSLVVGQQYLVQVQGNNCGGGGDRFSNYCISIYNPAANAFAGSASIINNCGVAFTGSTSGGHWNNGTSIGSNNLDNNNATQVGGASEVGDDVTFVINNCSWFTFCNGNAGSCNWSLNVNNITNCTLTGLNAGIQVAVFTGTPAALTNVAMSPSRVAPGGSFNSGTFAVGAGACTYVVVDGFAGDQCSYDLTLTNVSCPCLVLPLSLQYYAGMNYEDHISLYWAVSSETDLQHFIVEKSADGMNFSNPVEVDYDATLGAEHRYSLVDENPYSGWNFYRLKVVDMNGQVQYLNTVDVYHAKPEATNLALAQNGNQLEVNWISDFAGIGSIELVDPQGKVIESNEVQISEGEMQVLFDLNSLSAGVYVVRLHQGNRILSSKFVRF